MPNFPSDFSFGSLTFSEKLIVSHLNHNLSSFILSEMKKTDLSSDHELFHLFNFLPLVPEKVQKKCIEQHNLKYEFYKKSLTPKILSSKDIQSLLNFKTNLPTAYALLNSDRTRPGVILVKNAQGEFLKEKNKIWHRKILAESSRGLPFQFTNGRTPQGIYRMDSVMPEADQFYEFGRFRRVKLDFFKSIEDYKLRLPKEHHGLHWWKQSLVASSLGRSHLRIHGSGRLNFNPFSSHFPLVSSSGCLTLSEVDLKMFSLFHQKDLLKALLWGQGLDHTDFNELKIHGLLYCFETSGNFQTLEIV